MLVILLTIKIFIMRKLKVCFFVLFAVGTGLLSSCGLDDDNASSLEQNKQFLRTSSEELTEDFCALNEIPEDVLSRLDSSEVSLFRILSSKFRINYSFLDDISYQENKDSFLVRLMNLYEIYRDQNCPEIYLGLKSSSKSRLRQIETITPVEDGNGGASVTVITGNYPLFFGVTTDFDVLSNGYAIRSTTAAVAHPSDYNVFNVSSNASFLNSYFVIGYSADWRLYPDTTTHHVSGASPFYLTFPPK